MFLEVETPPYELQKLLSKQERSIQSLINHRRLTDDRDYIKGNRTLDSLKDVDKCNSLSNSSDQSKPCHDNAQRPSPYSNSDKIEVSLQRVQDFVNQYPESPTVSAVTSLPDRLMLQYNLTTPGCVAAVDLNLQSFLIS